MAVTTTNLIMGPGSLYSGAFGATEPVDTAVNSAPAASAWTDLGGTLNGVELTISQKYTALDVDQLVDVPERRLTSREIMVTTELAEPTMNNLTLALNNNVTAASAVGYSNVQPALGTSATQSTYAALIFDGFAPNGFRRRVIVRKALQTSDMKVKNDKKNQTTLPVVFEAHYVSSSIAPFKVVDQTA